MYAFIDWLLTGLQGLLTFELDISDAEIAQNFLIETTALYNTMVVSITTSVVILCVGAVIQAFFNLFGAFFNAPKVKKR